MTFGIYYALTDFFDRQIGIGHNLTFELELGLGSNLPLATRTAFLLDSLITMDWIAPEHNSYTH